MKGRKRSGSTWYHRGSDLWSSWGCLTLSAWGGMVMPEPGGERGARQDLAVVVFITSSLSQGLWLSTIRNSIQEEVRDLDEMIL